MPSKKSEKVPEQTRPIYDAIVAFTDEFCREHLDVEYAALARQMAAALARKRPSPLTSGRLESWACGILYALGRINFLFDRSQTPHLRADDLCRLCGVSQQTAASKAKAIEQALKTGRLDQRWMRHRLIDESPLTWFLIVNGLPVDIREMPREVQEIAYQKGYIPYIPDDGPPKDW